MAEWSVSKDSWGLACTNGELYLDLDYSCKDRLRSLFDQVLSFFLKKVYAKEIRPLPAVIGGGRKVDLFKLFWAVRRRGGLDSVSKNWLWDIVAEDCLLSSDLVVSLKLVYVKYLKEFDGWLDEAFIDGSLESEGSVLLEKLDLLLGELEVYRCSFSSGKSKNESNVVESKYYDKGGYIVVESSDSEGGNWRKKNYGERVDLESKVNKANGRVLSKQSYNELDRLDGDAKIDRAQKNVEARIIVGEERCSILDDGGVDLSSKNSGKEKLFHDDDKIAVVSSGCIAEKVRCLLKRKLELEVNEDRRQTRAKKGDIKSELLVGVDKVNKDNEYLGTRSTDGDEKSSIQDDNGGISLAEIDGSYTVSGRNDVEKGPFLLKRGSELRISEDWRQIISKKGVDELEGHKKINGVNENAGIIIISDDDEKSSIQDDNMSSMKNAGKGGLVFHNLSSVVVSGGSLKKNLPCSPKRNLDLELSGHRKKMISDKDDINYVSMGCEKDIQMHENVETGVTNVVQNVHSLTLPVNNVGTKVPVSGNDDSVTVPSASVIDKVPFSPKRKCVASSLSTMLNWLTDAARRSNDPAVGKIPESSKWKEYRHEEQWVLALEARRMLSVTKQVDINIAGCPLQKPKIHPCLYEDIDQNVSKGSRCTRSVPLPKSASCPCCSSCSDTPMSPCKAEEEKLPEDIPTSCMINDVSTDKNQISSEMNDTIDLPKQKQQVSVGPRFQAEIPPWTGKAYECDPKWLGTRMWTPEENNENGSSLIGKGREGLCQCDIKGSTICVQFHIAENRKKLKHELGPLFFRWGFHRMGEEVSLLWTPEEENRFELMVKEECETINRFWKKAFKLFPKKTREQLVSYYFNVLVIRRRKYQNRVTPKDIDSDDDEKDFGSFGDRFGYRGTAPWRELPICLENVKCSDVE